MTLADKLLSAATYFGLMAVFETWLSPEPLPGAELAYGALSCHLAKEAWPGEDRIGLTAWAVAFYLAVALPIRMIAFLAAGSVVLAVAAPAAADEILSPDQRAQRYERCIHDYGQDDAERCLELTHPGIRTDSAIHDYFLRDREAELQRERRCWDDPRILNPRMCSEGHAPVFSRRRNQQ